MGLKAEIKSRMILEGWSVKAVNDELNRRHAKEDTPQNLSNKLSRETLRYNEVVEIADILGYKIKWVKKDI